MSDRVASLRIAVLEDDATVREAVLAALTADPAIEVVAAVETVSDALATLDATPPDIFLVDLALPDGSGVDVVRAASAATKVRTLVFSVFADAENVLAALRAGACGYLLKSEADERLPRALHEAANGGAPMSAEVAAHVMNLLRTLEPATPDPPSVLTGREHEVLSLLASGYRRRDVAERLEISVHTVSAHVKQIYEKLAVHSNVEALRRATELGLLRP